MSSLASLRTLVSKAHPKLRTRSTCVIGFRGICHKDHIDPEVAMYKPKPWPYEKWKYNYWYHNLLRIDRCVTRWDENTKIIIVDGPPAVGKTQFAKELAEQLGMRHIEELTSDKLFIDRGGFDYRILNWRLPISGQIVDHKMFMMNPYHPAVPGFQLTMYKGRYLQYLEALSHVFNTGQGVIMERSPHVDYAWWQTLHKLGYVPDDAIAWAKHLRRETIWELKRPHLVIYLDISPEESLKRIKARGVDYEVSSKAINLEFLETLEHFYKNQYLQDASKHSELLIYDWTTGVDMDMVIEDLEKLDFDQYEARGERMEDWRYYNCYDYDQWRRYYTNMRHTCLRHFKQPTYDAPSLEMTDEEAELYDYVMKTYGPKWEPEFDPNKYSWWKIALSKMNGHNYRLIQEDGFMMPVKHHQQNW